jgi:large subunit ribosomal protein L22
MIPVADKRYDETVASARFVRVTPQKARRVAKLVSGKPVQEAISILRFSPQAVTEPILKLVKSATANAKTKADRDGTDFDESYLYVSKIFVDEGATMKRFRPRAKGKGDRRLKKTSHITLTVAPKEGDL